MARAESAIGAQPDSGGTAEMIEPHAKFILDSIADGVAPQGTTCMEALTVSIAISLKRIADMLDGTTLGLNCRETIFNPQTVQNREVRNI